VVSEIASKSQLRMSFLRWALVCVAAIEFFGFLSGYLSNSGYGNAWFAALDKPAITPPGWVFGTVWPLLYLLLGLALAIIINARGARGRGLAIIVFLVQLICNFAWSPVFFGARQASLGFLLILVIFVLAVVTTLLFGRIRSLAAWLMVPYLAWLSFAGILAYQIDQRNPDAERLVPGAASTQI
jgi:translocator protein